MSAFSNLHLQLLSRAKERVKLLFSHIGLSLRSINWTKLHRSCCQNLCVSSPHKTHKIIQGKTYLVDEPNNGFKVRPRYALEVDQRVRVGVAYEKPAKEWRAGRENHLVSECHD